MKEKTLQRFIKDYNLPIPILSPPYFEYYINIYDSLLGTKAKFALLRNEVDKFASEDEFLENYLSIRDKIVCDIQENPSFQLFTQSNPEVEMMSYPDSIYKVPHSGKYFVSIDLTKANFQAMNYFDKNILKADTYEDFIGRYTDSEYMKQSKYLRQVIFGALNPKKQVAYEKIMTNKVFTLAVKMGLFKEDDVKAFYNDEIVVEISENDFNTVTLSKFAELVNGAKDIGIDIHIEMFKLEAITDRNFFKKTHLDGSYSLKSVPAMYFAQVYKHIEGIELTEYDRLFYNDGIMCMMLNTVFD